MKNGGQIAWNVTAICETFKISCLMGRHHMKGGSEYHLTDQLSRLEQWSNITLFLQKTYRDYIKWPKGLARYIPWICGVRGGNLERRHNGRRH